MLPSGSFTEAMSFPPPMFSTSWMTWAPSVSRDARPFIYRLHGSSPSCRHGASWDLECSLAFLGLLSARSIESDGRADERLGRIRVNLLTLVNVDGAPCVPVKARVEELGRILQGSTLEEGQLHYRLVRLSPPYAPA